MTPRRWFRFNLRTMLVVVALFGCWLSHQIHWLRERESFSRYAFVVTRFGETAAPWSLRLLGVDDVKYVVVDAQSSGDEENRARRMFPEAEIIREAKLGP